MKVYRDLNNLPKFKASVLTIGSFDGVHLGHQSLLERIAAIARDAGGQSVVVTFDPHPRHVLPAKGPELKLLSSTTEKIEKFDKAGIDCLILVPFTPEFSKMTPLAYIDDFLVGKFKPHTIVIGYDHRFGAQRKGNIDTLKKRCASLGVNIIEIKAKDVDELAVSSTRIRQAITDGKIESANLLLGSNYKLVGTVIKGKALGRTIGYPTANLAIKQAHKLIPGNGVYAVKVSLEKSDKPLDGMLYIGKRPSVDINLETSIEVNILNFSGDLYGQELKIELLARIRADQTFDSLEALKQQIDLDRQQTIKVLQKFA